MTFGNKLSSMSTSNTGWFNTKVHWYIVTGHHEEEDKKVTATIVLSNECLVSHISALKYRKYIYRIQPGQ